MRSADGDPVGAHQPLAARVQRDEQVVPVAARHDVRRLDRVRWTPPVRQTQRLGGRVGPQPVRPAQLDHPDAAPERAEGHPRRAVRVLHDTRVDRVEVVAPRRGHDHPAVDPPVARIVRVERAAGVQPDHRGVAAERRRGPVEVVGAVVLVDVGGPVVAHARDELGDPGGLVLGVPHRPDVGPLATVDGRPDLDRPAGLPLVTRREHVPGLTVLPDDERRVVRGQVAAQVERGRVRVGPSHEPGDPGREHGHHGDRREQEARPTTHRDECLAYESPVIGRSTSLYINDVARLGHRSRRPGSRNGHDGGLCRPTVGTACTACTVGSQPAGPSTRVEPRCRMRKSA